MKSINRSLDAIAYYGADFIPDVIVGAEGSEVITSNGTRILDWTSGQVSTGLKQLPPSRRLRCQFVSDVILAGTLPS